MADPSTYVNELQRVPIFADLSTRDLESIAKSLKERTYEQGAVILKQGDPGVGFFLIAEGRVEVSHNSHTIRDMGPGEFFGEMALLVERERTATVTAKERTRCLQLVRWDFRALLGENPELAVKLLEVVAHRLTEHPLKHEMD
jgi:CRP-like cAMP-binding protein